MKQAELTKTLNAELRTSAKAHNWNFKGGFVFKATELLFFSIVVVGQAKGRYLYYSLTFKLLAFDDLFWKIVKTEANSREPLSFRASGAWTAPMTMICDGKLSFDDWAEVSLHSTVNDIIDRCEAEAARVANEIRGLDDNLDLIEKIYTQLKNEHPSAVKSLWVERLLSAILKNEYDRAETIIRDRLTNHDSGGFQVGPKSFYDLAGEYVKGLDTNV